jgi:hypothetical protein
MIVGAETFVSENVQQSSSVEGLMPKTATPDPFGAPPLAPERLML